MLTIYKALSVIAFPIIEVWLIFRVLKGKENKISFSQRFAKTNHIRPDADIIWVHAVSVGEVNSAFTLIDEIFKQDKNISIVLTTTTLTSAQIVESKLENYQNRLIHQFLPADLLYVVRSFLEFWQFKKAIFVESEIWPNFINESHKLGIEIYLVNARISQKSFEFWIFLQKFLFCKIFDKFKKIFVQNEGDIKKFEQLKAKEVLFLGDLKSQSNPLSFDEKKLKKLKSATKNRKIFLAASTHKNEEEVILDCHQKLKTKFPNLLTIIVPRHPNRSSEISKLLTGFRFAIRSKNQKIDINKDIYLVDSIGELGLFYKLADFAFIGGSLAKIGGHNPYEAIKLDCAVVSGHNFFNFNNIYQNLENNYGCFIAKSNSELLEIVENLLTDQNLLNQSLKNAQKIIKNSNISQKIVKNLQI